MPLCIEVYFFKLEFKLGRGAEAMLGAPAAVGASWRFTAADAGDRADKFGWLGVKGKEGTSSADRISFRLEFSGLGFLAFEFLRSYAWDGRVSIIIDGKRPLLDLGSHWEDQSSQRVTNYLALGTSKNINVGHGRSKKLTNRHYVPGFRAGFHNVTFVLKGPPSSRFKLYTLLTC